MSDMGTPPVIPADLQQYNSYVTDPHYARMFSIIWPSVLGFFVLRALPGLIRRSARAVRLGRGYVARALCARVLGVREEWGVDEDFQFEYDGGGVGKKAGSERGVKRVNEGGNERIGRRQGVLSGVEDVLGRAGAVFYWTLPGLGLNAGQIILVGVYILAVVLCIVLQAPLVSNSNRAGFIALAQLPLLFLVGTKNSPLALLFGPAFSYDKLNFVHRWSGRLMFLGALLHGSLWIRNHLEYGIPIIGAQKEESGIASFALLGVIAVSSVRGVRRGMWEVFWVLHMLAFPAFFITICYHTIYAAPWIFPPLAFYGLDLLVRMLKHRTLDAVLVPVDKQMTLVHIPHVTTGWRAGQHVRLRIYASSGGAHIFESHPLSIYTAPPDVSCVRPSSMPALSSIPLLPAFVDDDGCDAGEEKGSEQKNEIDEVEDVRIPRGMSLGIRAVGDWSSAVNAYARAAGEASTSSEKHSHSDSKSKPPPPAVPVQVTLDGPYGGCSLDLGEYETVLLFAGGAGVTFTLGLLDDLVGRIVRQGRRGGEKTTRVEFAWCVRSFGSIDWFAPALKDIASAAASPSSSLDLHISIYVTCLCNPEAVPPIPNCDVTLVRPSVSRVLRELTGSSGAVKKKGAEKTTKTVADDGSSAEPRLSSADMSSVDEDDIEEIDVEEAGAGVPRLPSLSPSSEGGGLAVCASGPESLVREAANAVARMQMPGRGGGRRRVGRVGLHTEVFMV